MCGQEEEGQTWLVRAAPASFKRSSQLLPAASAQLRVKWLPFFQLVFLPVLLIFATRMLMTEWLKYVARCVWQVSL